MHDVDSLVSIQQIKLWNGSGFPAPSPGPHPNKPNTKTVAASLKYSPPQEQTLTDVQQRLSENLTDLGLEEKVADWMRAWHSPHEICSYKMKFLRAEAVVSLLNSLMPRTKANQESPASVGLQTSAQLQ